MKKCGECPLLADCRQILDVDESTTLTEDCPIWERVSDIWIKQLIQKVAEVVVKARQSRQD